MKKENQMDKDTFMLYKTISIMEMVIMIGQEEKVDLQLYILK
jgi:hypothetical protein